MLIGTAHAQAGGAPAAIDFVTQQPHIQIIVVFYFQLIRPQQRRMREHQAQIAAVKKGDRVVTGGGLIGKVTKVTDNEVEVELGQGVRVTAVKSTLTQVIDPTAAKPAND